MKMLLANVISHFPVNLRVKNISDGTLRTLHLCSCMKREGLKNLKGKSKSSQDWLTRQMKDPYVEKARISNYRCRSAFKLLEIDKKYNLLSPGQCVLDCGAAPGSWTQIAVEKTNALGKNCEAAKGFVIGIDINPIYPIDGAILLSQFDFTSKEAQGHMLKLMDGRKADVVLSDMAPNATGVREMDHDKITHLAYSAFRFSALVSNVGATFLVKLWDGSVRSQMTEDLKKFYNNVKVVKPHASRSDSAELFLLARNFKGLAS